MITGVQYLATYKISIKVLTFENDIGFLISYFQLMNVYRVHLVVLKKNVAKMGHVILN